MKNIFKYMMFFSTAILLSTHCENNPASPTYQKEVSVFGFLWAEQSLSKENAISITYSQPISQYYDISQAAIQNGDITFEELPQEKAIKLIEDNNRPGFYYNDDIFIKAGGEYQLTINVDGKTVTATTRVPTILETYSDLDKDSVTVISEKNWGYKMPIYLNHENPNQLIMTDMYCNENWQNAEYITPFHNHTKPDNREEYDGGINGEPRHIYALVPYKDLKSAEFAGEPTIFWYSSMLVFRGSYIMTVMAIDDNYHNYLTKEHPVFSGGINGGIGVFGSMSGKKYQLFVTSFETKIN